MALNFVFQDTLCTVDTRAAADPAPQIEADQRARTEPELLDPARGNRAALIAQPWGRALRPADQVRLRTGRQPRP